MKKFFTLISTICLALAVFVEGVPARQIARHKAMTANVADDFKCGDQVEIIILAPDSSYFRGNMEDFQTMAGVARAGLSVECPGVKSIVISGRTGGREVYRGFSVEAAKWVITDIPLSSTIPVIRSAKTLPATEPPPFLNSVVLEDWSYGSASCRPSSGAVDRAGNIFVAVMQDSSVHKYNKAGKLLTKWGGLGNGDGQFKYPLGIAVDKAGNVFVADTGNERVQKFNNAGKFLSKWGAHAVARAATGYRYDNGGFFSPAGISVDESGNVYVSDASLGRIQKFDNNGRFLLKLGRRGGNGDGQFITPAGVSVDSAGNIYVADRGNKRIQKFDSRGKFLTKWGEKGKGDGQFSWPQGIVIDPADNVYVADSTSKRIQKFDNSGKFLAKWGSPARDWLKPEKGTFGSPVDLTIDENGTIFVIDETACMAHAFGQPGAVAASADNASKDEEVSGQKTGHMPAALPPEKGPVFLSKWTPRSSSDDISRTAVFPAGIAADRTGNVYVADKENDRILKFDTRGRFITVWGSYGDGDGQFKDPRAVATDSDGNVYVSDIGTHSIQKFDSSGRFLARFGSKGKGAGQLDQPWDVAVDDTGYVYVADLNNDRVQKFDRSGKFIASIGSYGGGKGQFNRPVSVAIDASGFLYVADYYNHRIQKFDREGNLLTVWEQDNDMGRWFSRVEDMVVDGDGNLNILEERRVVKLNPDGYILSIWGEYGYDDSDLNLPAGIAVDGKGRFFVADASANIPQIKNFGPAGSGSIDESNRQDTDRLSFDHSTFVRPELMRSLVLGIDSSVDNNYHQLLMYAWGITGESRELESFVNSSGSRSTACGKLTEAESSTWKNHFIRLKSAIKRQADDYVKRLRGGVIFGGLEPGPRLPGDTPVEVQNQSIGGEAVARKNIEDGKIDIERLMELEDMSCNRQVMISLLRSLERLTWTDEMKRERQMPPKSNMVKQCDTWSYMRGDAENVLRDQRNVIKHPRSSPQFIRQLERRIEAFQALETLYCTDEMQTEDSCGYWESAMEKYDEYTAGMSFQAIDDQSAQKFQDAGDFLQERIRRTCGSEDTSRLHPWNQRGNVRDRKMMK